MAHRLSALAARTFESSPLARAGFRNFYLGSIGAALGYTMQATISAWLMATLTTSALMVALVQSASTAPTLLFGLFAGLALLLATVGVYGALTASVSQRTRELGVRIALGATARDVGRMIVGQGLKLVLSGIALGLVGALALRRMIEKLLFGVSPTDPLTYAVIASLLIGVALLACWIPARRATKVDPLVALRSE